MRKFILLFVLVLLPFPGCDDSTESKNNVNNANNVNNSSNSNNTNNINNVNNVNNTNNINNSNNITCEEVYPVTEGTRVALFTTDYTSGSLSVVSMDGSSVKVDSDAALVHSDALGRSFDTELYVISRLGGDNIARFNPQTWSVATQFSTGPGTNPQDFAMVSQCKGYISLYADDQLLIVDPSVGAAEPILGAINLFEYSDEDGSPEASFMTLDDGILMVAIQNLVNYAPQGNGRIILVDTATDAVSGVIALNTPNPFTTLVRVP
ncbi:hypothetical protein KKF84_01705, partial [Myxococcota bacterium]|nr:hypothetical protein [Myxococcota bacterium]MBU1534001.1 hypothetical protein [Myxococcota bacterium]